jgi:hypothetical protein
MQTNGGREREKKNLPCQQPQDQKQTTTAQFPVTEKTRQKTENLPTKRVKKKKNVRLSGARNILPARAPSHSK